MSLNGATADSFLAIKPGFRRFVSSVLLAGLCAGLLLTAVQKIQATPIIARAEVYEEAAAKVAQTALEKPTTAAMDMHARTLMADAHQHEAVEWEPTNGVERSLYTVMANVTMAVGFALLLGAAILLRGGISGWREGLLWGIAGYVVVFVAPSLGLAPEVPGTQAAPLLDRQLWWTATATLTAISLALLVFGRHWSLKLLAVVLLLAPHLAGAPEPQIHGGAAPAELVRAFIYATAIANGIFWLGLGGAFGFFYKQLTDSKG
ncbi:CbtA family protein [Glaciimonas sp. PAMC28666]|uniref:CbtA family protein n=1 Tax=Glaciimonas sp. PAMC28666 TaxID=2807626 RepID=UPI001966B159|nr:CbtA family protein [Glaciimonas sp. PAMC28666]QRX84154.1 CbtA family protein [Glaciimonas sp. PAMC28666]